MQSWKLHGLEAYMNTRVVLVILAVVLLTTAFPTLAHDTSVPVSDTEYLISALGIIAIMLAVIMPVKKRNLDHILLKKKSDENEKTG